MTAPETTRPDRVSRVQQFYGYAVCLIAIVTFLVSASGFVDAVFDRAAPLQAGVRPYGFPEASLTSFEAFQATYRRPGSTDVDMVAYGPGAAPPVPGRAATSPSELRAQYEALRADRIAHVTFSSTQRLVRNGLLVLLALALFVTHWRWLRGLAARHAG